MNQPATLHLASTSPRRREILSALGLEFTIIPVEVDETPAAGEDPADMVERLAVEKARAAAVADHAVVVAADTAVVIDGEALGKPESHAECRAMLAALSGRVHTVVTGVAVRRAGDLFTAASSTQVQFRDISQDEADAYWQSGEPRDKAGGYAIQGLGGTFVRRIEGSYSGVVGLPVFETVYLLQQAGITVLTKRQAND